MSSRVTAVAASVSTLTLVALTACAPASARSPNEGDSTAIPVIARDIAPSTRAWSTTASGIVQANTTVDVTFQVPGKVVMVGPDEGQTVRAGQIIAALDPTDYRLTVEQVGSAGRPHRPRSRPQSPYARRRQHRRGRHGPPRDRCTSERRGRRPRGRSSPTRASRRRFPASSRVAPSKSAPWRHLDNPSSPSWLSIRSAFVSAFPKATSGTSRSARRHRFAFLRWTRASLAASRSLASLPIRRLGATPSRSRCPTRRTSLRAGMVAEATISTSQTSRRLWSQQRPYCMMEASTPHDRVYARSSRSRVHARRVTTGVSPWRLARDHDGPGAVIACRRRTTPSPRRRARETARRHRDCPTPHVEASSHEPGSLRTPESRRRPRPHRLRRPARRRALLTMPRREDPKITIRTGLVLARYPGATASQVEEQVTRKIEERLFRHEEVRKLKTFSTSRDGVVVVNVELEEWVKDPDRFWAMLRHDMNELQAIDLPPTVQGPIVNSNFGDVVAMLLAVRGPHYGPRELRSISIASTTRFARSPKFSKINRLGEQREELRVSTTNARLAGFGITPLQVATAIRSGPPCPTPELSTSARRPVPIDARSLLGSEAELSRLLVGSSRGRPPRARRRLRHRRASLCGSIVRRPRRR